MKEFSAGAVLYTVINGEVNFLVMKDFHDNWGFPKGHLENDESFKDAALREIKEEVGIDAEIVTTFKKELVYKLPNGNEKHSLYYIAKFDNQTPVKQDAEVQEIKILNYEETYCILTFPNMKNVLRSASKYIEALI